MDSARCSGPYWKIPPAPGTNQIARFVEFRLLTSCKKDKLFLIVCITFDAIKLKLINK